jgi:hypothetical protein
LSPAAICCEFNCATSSAKSGPGKAGGDEEAFRQARNVDAKCKAGQLLKQIEKAKGA